MCKLLTRTIDWLGEPASLCALFQSQLVCSVLRSRCSAAPRNTMPQHSAMTRLPSGSPTPAPAHRSRARRSRSSRSLASSTCRAATRLSRLRRNDTSSRTCGPWGQRNPLQMLTLLAVGNRQHLAHPPLPPPTTEPLPPRRLPARCTRAVLHAAPFHSPAPCAVGSAADSDQGGFGHALLL